jgi:precorrin-2/cobalt-factor-2 C20-methyltransferase
LNNIGTLYGIGVGPGDPELLTVKAFRLLKECPVIAYPRKRHGAKSYAMEIVDVYVDPEQKEMLGLIFPMTRDKEELARQWNSIVEEVWSCLEGGKDVAFITEGDPMLYSTFIHLMRLMNEIHSDVRIVSVPGISSITAAPSRLGIPLADGDEHIGIIPATADKAAMRKALEDHDSVVFIKVAKVLDSMIAVLRELQLLDKAAVLTKVSSADELIWRQVGELEGQELEYLTLMVVRK